MGSLFLNYLLEFAMLLPAAAVAILPLRKSLRYEPGTAYTAAFACLVVFCVVGAIVGSLTLIPSRYLIAVGCVLLFVPFFLISTLSPAKKIFCFLDAAMLMTFAVMYSVYIVAPWEIDNTASALAVRSGATMLLVETITCALFAWPTGVELPDLFENESLDRFWKWVALSALAIVALLIWATPEDFSNVMVGYLRPKSLVFLLLVPVSVWVIHHVAWLASTRTLASARMQREYELLKFEEKRYNELFSYVDDARAMRHDFRHHMAVVSELAHAGKASEVAAYADQFVLASREAQVSLYCENNAVDALAAHYDNLAQARGVKVTWSLNIPSEVPVEEIDFCSVFGNLVENAIVAAAECDDGFANVKASVFSGDIVTLVVENNFEGEIALSEDGHPLTDREGHGIGLASVETIVRKYDGDLSVKVDGSVFSASALLYANVPN